MAIGILLACAGQVCAQELTDEFRAFLRVSKIREGDWAVYVKDSLTFKETVLRVEKTDTDVLVYYWRERVGAPETDWAGKELRFSLAEERANREREVALLEGGEAKVSLHDFPIRGGRRFAVMVFDCAERGQIWYCDKIGITGAIAFYPKNGEGTEPGWYIVDCGGYGD